MSDLQSCFYFQSEMAAPVTHAIAGGEAVVFAVSAPAKQTPNEDAIALIPLGDRDGVLAVADGVGGLPGGEQASNLALRRLEAVVREGFLGKEIGLRAAILDGIDSANRALLDEGSAGATTLAVAEIRDGRLRTYHVGDSVILLTGQRGRIKLQTIAHSPVGYAVESGILNEREAMEHADRHLIDNVLGAADMRIEIGPDVGVSRRDTLLLATDGLADNLFPEEIVEAIRKGCMDAGAEMLCSVSRRRMLEPREGVPSKPDDLSFITWRPSSPV